MQTDKRKLLQPVMTFHILLMPIEFVFYCLSIWQSSTNASDDSKPELVAVICWCAIDMALILFCVLGWVRHYDKNGAEKYKFFKLFYYDKKTNCELTERMETLLKKMHEISLAKWTDFVRQKVADLTELDEEMKQEAIDEASSTLADYMSDLDLTKSDVFMGLLLLRWQSSQWIGKRSALNAQYVLENTDPITTDLAAEPIDPRTMTPRERLTRDWLHISRIRRYIHFALASYGWKHYVGWNTCNLRARRRMRRYLTSDNMPTPNKQRNMEEGIPNPGGGLWAGQNAYLAAFLEMSSLNAEDILIFEIADTFYDAALMLVVDHQTQALVLIVRGTASGNDKLVDLIAMGEPLREEDKTLPEAERFMSHAGMTRVARNIAGRMINEQWIEEARRRFPDYPLVICGHSLGAGIVSLLAVLLRPRYPELRAYAYAPPGGLMNPLLSEHTRDFVCSFVYGYDCIPRLNTSSLEDLRARLVHALVVCQVPKALIMPSRIAAFVLRLIGPCFGLPTVGEIGAFLPHEVKEKLRDPKLEDIYATPFGENFKAHADEVTGGVSHVDRLLAGERSLMRWKKPEARKLLRLPRPYPKSMCSELLSQANIDKLLSTLSDGRFGARVIHLLEVDSDFEVPGVKPFKKKGYVPPPIAVWSDSTMFNTILVHPKMYFNHVPLYVSAAWDRLWAAIQWPDRIFYKMDYRNFTDFHKPLPGVKRKPEELDEAYCRIRVMRPITG